MANTYADRVQETSTTTGTGTYDLAGPTTGYQGFVAGAGDASTVTYLVTDGTDWEVGTGLVTDAATDTLSRASILSSSNAGSAVNWGAGTKTISLTLPASVFAAHDRPVAFLSDVKSAGTDGGTATSGSWFTRALTEEADPDGIVTVSSNQFTLQAGTYEIKALAIALDVDSHKIRLRNITDSTTDIVGLSTHAQDSNSTGTTAYLEGLLTIAGAKVFELQHRVQVTSATLGQGVAGDFGEDEKYALVKIKKRA